MHLPPIDVAHGRSRPSHLWAPDGYAVAHHDHPGTTPVGRCLLIPPIGSPARALAPLADALTESGWATARLDARNHVGDGTGGIVDLTLGSLAEDIARAIERTRPTCVLAVGLAARAALRALADTATPATAVLVAPVVSTRTSIARAVGVDLWLRAGPGRRRPHGRLATAVADGFEISAELCDDAARRSMVAVDDAVADAARTTGPVVMITGLHDLIVDLADLSTLAAADPDRIGLRTAPVAGHLGTAGALDGDRWCELLRGEICRTVANRSAHSRVVHDGAPARPRSGERRAGSSADGDRPPDVRPTTPRRRRTDHEPDAGVCTGLRRPPLGLIGAGTP